MNGRSIQDIVPPARSKPIRPSVTPPQQRDPERFDMNTPHTSNSWIFIWIAVGALVIAAGTVLFMSTVSHSAEASVTLMEWKSDISGTYTAGGETPLAYTPVKVVESGTRTVPATGMTDAQDRASGTIVVSNLHSTKSQRLITNTRFATQDGKVYRIHAPITVPGYTMKNGQKVAGTIEAQIYADQPGDTYNVDSADFKLPGLKGSQQYDQITARTKTPIMGGFIGKRATIEKSVRDQAVAEVKAELDRTLRERIKAEAPSTALVFQDSVRISYIEAPDTASDAEATIQVTGTALAPAFDAAALARELAARASVAADSTLELKNAPELTYTEAQGEGLSEGGALSFNLSGTAHIAAQFDSAKFAADLAGKSKSQTQAVRSSYQALTGPLDVDVYPFWLSTLPKNPERITVTVKGALDQLP
ncbi:MAG: hypothetical protein NBV63_01860 [Candidatus Pacebacteria bacterium]|nr:hypothetical protein [Candidatus Paceibacterota bacterium]